MYKNPLTAIDFYKADHRRQYPEGTEYVYSNFTPRSNKIAKNLGIETDEVVFFGLLYFVQDFLIKTFNENFFAKPLEVVLQQYKRRMDNALGVDTIDIKHIEALHNLGYLPIHIKAIPEGSKAKIGTPVLTIVNTLPTFFWLTNYFESILSNTLWKLCTSATIAHEYKKLLLKWAKDTGADCNFVQFQAHDFSFRGMSGLEDAASNGAAHLLSFVGTDTVAAIDFLEEFYKADCTQALIGCSVPATEHSVMCMGGKEDEVETFRRLIEDTYPKGIVSIVSDTWDFWKVLTEYLPQLKDKILARDGKVVIRPDSGDPVKILCGTAYGLSNTVEIDEPHLDKMDAAGFEYFTHHGKYYKIVAELSYVDERQYKYVEVNPTPEMKGAVEILWSVFGGTVTDKGYRVLDSHIGLIYGDSITYKRANQILTGLAAKGFASTNVVFGVGSYTYQYSTRDTFGFAMKATYGVVKGEGREIFKDPITDDGTKKSARGLLRVDNGVLKDRVTVIEELGGDLQSVFKDGFMTMGAHSETIGTIRKRLATKE